MVDQSHRFHCIQNLNNRCSYTPADAAINENNWYKEANIEDMQSVDEVLKGFGVSHENMDSKRSRHVMQQIGILLKKMGLLNGEPISSQDMEQIKEMAADPINAPSAFAGEADELSAHRDSEFLENQPDETLSTTTAETTSTGNSAIQDRNERRAARQRGESEAEMAGAARRRNRNGGSTPAPTTPAPTTPAPTTPAPATPAPATPAPATPAPATPAPATPAPATPAPATPAPATPAAGQNSMFTGASPAGRGSFSVGGQTFGHAFWASGTAFMNDPNYQKDLKEYVKAASAAGQTAPIVIYGLGDVNGGSAQAVDKYAEYIKIISDSIGDAKAEIYFEPDLSGLHTKLLNDPMILDAIQYLDQNNPNAKILMDTTHSNWHTDLSPYMPAYKAQIAAGADGFIGNVSNYRPNDELAAWMHRELYSEFGDSVIYAIDTSRNGAATMPAGVQAGEWADVEGAGLGEKTGGSMTYQGMTLQFRHVKPATEADVTPYPGAIVSSARLQSLYSNSLHAR